MKLLKIQHFQFLIVSFISTIFFFGCVHSQQSPVQRDVSSAAPEIWTPSEDDLIEWFGSCEVLHLTQQGYLRLAPTPFLKRFWNWDDLTDLKKRALYRLESDLDVRSTFHLQLAFATSFQAGAVYQKLQDKLTAEKGVSGRTQIFIDREALEERALSAHAKMIHSRAGSPASARGPLHEMPNCAMTKWLNKRPDVFLWPVSQGFKRNLARLFGPESVVRETRSNRFQITPEEEEVFTFDGQLDREAVFELRALRLATALFERQSRLLLNDVGGWDGNKASEGKKFVCTDEATTHYAFLKFFVEDTGLLKQFEIDPDTRFAFRRPPLDLPLLQWLDRQANELFGITDHFGVILRHKQSQKLFVLDSWVEDGGVPAHISSIEDWLDKKETNNVVSIGDPKWDRILSRTSGDIQNNPESGSHTAEPLRRKITDRKDERAARAHQNYVELLAYLQELIPDREEVRSRLDPTEDSGEFELLRENRFRRVRWPLEKN